MSAVVTKLSLPSLRERVSPEEWQTRVELAACYRLAHHYGWQGTNFGTHFSARVPGEPEHFLLNPVGLLFDEVTASSLIKVDAKGNKLNDSPYRVNNAGVALHGGCYMARPDVMGVLHTHTDSGVALSMLECGLLPVSMAAVRFHKRVGYYDFRGPGDNMSDRDRLGESLGPHMALIMRNHGLIAVGRTIGEAFVVMCVLEQACSSQLLAMQTGAKLLVPDDTIVDPMAAKRDGMNDRNNDGNWQTMMRLADRLDPGYRQ
jgi:ribulose-5-phosphate 4-epimerase/fuculose-1-phosphate aldolase